MEQPIPLGRGDCEGRLDWLWATAAIATFSEAFNSSPVRVIPLAFSALIASCSTVVTTCWVWAALSPVNGIFSTFSIAAYSTLCIGTLLPAAADVSERTIDSLGSGCPVLKKYNSGEPRRHGT